jgi:hypothetical protein
MYGFTLSLAVKLLRFIFKWIQVTSLCVRDKYRGDTSLSYYFQQEWKVMQFSKLTHRRGNKCKKWTAGPVLDYRLKTGKGLTLFHNSSTFRNKNFHIYVVCVCCSLFNDVMSVSCWVYIAWITYTRVYPKSFRTVRLERELQALCHYIQLHRYTVSQSNVFYCHNPLCCFSTSICFSKRTFLYRLSSGTFGYTLVCNLCVCVQYKANAVCT